LEEDGLIVGFEDLIAVGFLVGSNVG